MAAALVMFMQAGFSMLESGSVRTKNSINVSAKNFADFCLTAAVFWAFGYAFMFGDSVGGWFGFSDFLPPGHCRRLLDGVLHFPDRIRRDGHGRSCPAPSQSE